MKSLVTLLLVLMTSMIAFSQPPPYHPALQLRKYYCDIYTGQSIVCFESTDLDSILVVASKFIVPAQVISLYSYIDKPYSHERIFAKTLEKDSLSLLYRNSAPRYSVSLRSFPGNRKSLKHYRYLSRAISGCDSNR